MKVTRKVPFAAIAIGAIALLAGCQAGSPVPSGPATASGQPISVGTLFSTTGTLGPTGLEEQGGVQLAVDELNAAGGVLGRPLTVTSLDDEGTAAVAVTRAQELISDGVSVVFEGVISPTSLASQPVFARAGIMDLTITASADAILDGTNNPDAIRLNANTALTGKIIADYANKQGFKRIVILYQNDAYGQAHIAAVQAALKTAPIESIAFDPKQTDFRVEMDKAIADNPDLVMLVNSSSDVGGPAMIQQLRSAGYKGQFTMAPTTMAQKVIDAAGVSAEGGVSAATYFADKAPFTGYDANNAYVTAWKAQSGGVLPTHTTTLAYTAVKVWAAAVEAAKGLDDKAAIAAEIKGHTFKDTPFGDVTFDKTGQMSSTLTLYQVKDGKISTF
ncbi:MAG: livJ 2 [Rhodoglobus sp.]|nr:livJ 2 [Rhodoglobus sp.]